MPEDVSVTMDPQKRISRGEGSELRIEIEKLDDESTTNESLQTVKFAVAPKVRPTLDEKQQEQDEIKTMDDLGKAPLPHGSHVFALVGLFFLAVPLWLSVVCSWVWLVLLGALLPTFVVVSTLFASGPNTTADICPVPTHVCRAGAAGALGPPAQLFDRQGQKVPPGRRFLGPLGHSSPLGSRPAGREDPRGRPRRRHHGESPYGLAGLFSVADIEV